MGLQRTCFLLVALCGLWPAVTDSANPNRQFLVGTELSTSSASGYTIVATQALAQEFVLTAPVKTSSITFVVGGSYKDIGGGAGGFGEDVAFLAQLTRGIGPQSTILAENDFVFKAAPDRYYATTYSLPLHLMLETDTYYLVLSTNSVATVGYLTWGPNQELESSVGHLDIAYYANPSGYERPNEAPFIPATIGNQVLQLQLLGRPVKGGDGG